MYLNYTVTIPFRCSNRESNFMKMLRQFKSFVLFLVSVIFLLAPLLREMVLKALARVGGGGYGGGDKDHCFPITLGLDNSHFIF